MLKTVREIERVRLDEKKLAADISQIVRKRRTSYEYTQDELTERAGVAKNFVWNLENGVLTLTTLMSTLRVLAALDIDICQVLQVAEVSDDGE